MERRKIAKFLDARLPSANTGKPAGRMRSWSRYVPSEGPSKHLGEMKAAK